MPGAFKFFEYAGEAHAVLVDQENLHILDAHKWSLTNGSRHVGFTKLYLRRRKYRGGKQVEVVYVRRQIAGALPNVVVDHIDGNGLNNTAANLRITTVEENARRQNRRRKS